MIKRNYGTKMKQCTHVSIYIHCTCIKNYINDNEHTQVFVILCQIPTKMNYYYNTQHKR